MRFYKVAIIIFSTAVLISCGGAEERKAVYLEKAKSSMAVGDYDKARIELKNVLQIDPKDDKAYFQLGKVYEQQKDFRKAFSNYTKAAELNPEELAYKARLGRLYLFLANDTVKTQEIIEEILSKDPDNADGLLLKAAALFKNDEKQEALGIVDGVLKKDTGNVDAVVFLATIYGNDKKYNEAISVLNTALQSNQDNKQLKNLLALMLINNNDYDRAEEIFKNFLEQDPDHSSSYNRLASLYDASGEKDKAEKILRESIDNNPKDAERYLTLVKYIRNLNGDDAAIAELEAAVKNNSGVEKLRLALGELYFRTGNKEAAIAVYTKAINDFPEEKTGVESRIILASVYLKDNDFEKANELIEDAFEVSPNDPKINLLRAKLALHEKDTEKAIISLRIVVKELPENIEAYLLLASAYQFENNDEQVQQTLNVAHDTNKNNAVALLKLAQYYLPRDIDKAENVIDDLLKIDNDSYKGLSVKSAILNKKKQQDVAFPIAEKLIELYDDKPNGYLQTVPYLVQQDKTSEAINTLELGYLAAKDNRKILSLLTNLQLSTKQYSAAEKRIKAELKASPQDSELNLLLAKIYLASNKMDKAENILKQIIADNPAIENPYLWLSQIYKRKNDNAAVKQVLEQGKDNVKSSYKIRFRLAAVYENEQDYTNAIQIYRDMYNSYPNNVVVLNNLAAMLSDHSDDAADLELAKTIADKLAESNQPVFLDTVGWVYYKIADYPKAVEFLLKAVENAPTVNVFNYHLGMAYKMSGDKTNAKVYLEKSLADKKQFYNRSQAESSFNEL